MVRPAWLTAGPPLEDGDRLDGFKVFLGCLKPAIDPERIQVMFDEANIARPEKFHFLRPTNDQVSAVFLVFYTAYDAAECIRLLRGIHSPLCNPVGRVISAHRGEIQAFKRSCL